MFILFAEISSLSTFVVTPLLSIKHLKSVGVVSFVVCCHNTLRVESRDAEVHFVNGIVDDSPRVKGVSAIDEQYKFVIGFAELPKLVQYKISNKFVDEPNFLKFAVLSGKIFEAYDFVPVIVSVESVRIHLSGLQSLQGNQASVCTVAWSDFLKYTFPSEA